MRNTTTIYETEYPEYWTIEIESRYGSWRTYQDDNFILTEVEQEAMDYAEKLSALYAVRVVHHTKQIVWNK